MTTTDPTVHLRLPLNRPCLAQVPTQLPSPCPSHPLAWGPFKDKGSISPLLCSAPAELDTEDGMGGGSRGLEEEGGRYVRIK